MGALLPSLLRILAGLPQAGETTSDLWDALGLEKDSREGLSCSGGNLACFQIALPRPGCSKGISRGI